MSPPVAPMASVVIRTRPSKNISIWKLLLFAMLYSGTFWYVTATRSASCRHVTAVVLGSRSFMSTAMRLKAKCDAKLALSELSPVTNVT